MWLNVRVIGVEDLFRAIDRELLDLIDKLTAAVVPLSGKTFSVLVGERRAHRLEHRLRDKILARDQLDAVPLALDFATNYRRYFWVILREHRHLRPLGNFSLLHHRLPVRRFRRHRHRSCSRGAHVVRPRTPCSSISTQSRSPRSRKRI